MEIMRDHISPAIGKTRRYQTLQALLNCTRRSLLPDPDFDEKDRDAWRKAGEAGLLCPWLEEELGGPGGDFLHSVVVMEEAAKAFESGLALGLHEED